MTSMSQTRLHVHKPRDTGKQEENTGAWCWRQLGLVVAFVLLVTVKEFFV